MGEAFNPHFVASLPFIRTCREVWSQHQTHLKQRQASWRRNWAWAPPRWGLQCSFAACEDLEWGLHLGAETAGEARQRAWFEVQVVLNGIQDWEQELGLEEAGEWLWDPKQVSQVAK